MATSSGDVAWRLPFNTYEPQHVGCCGGAFQPRATGTCMQGNHGNDTHKEELCYAFDFDLPVGTPVLASADGVVVAAVSSYRKGGRHSKEMRAKANFVAVRHEGSLYSRYYHLCYGGVCVKVGDRVAAGEQIGRSGNTGFSGAPHLHWDVVDMLPAETAALSLLHGAGSASRLELQCIAGSFSAAHWLSQSLPVGPPPPASAPGPGRPSSHSM